MWRLLTVLTLLSWMFVLHACESIAADAPRVLPVGQLPNDARLKPLKDYNGYFPFQPPKTVEEWYARRERVIRQIKVSQGIWPEPTKTPLQAVIHGAIDCGEYTVEKVYFESQPGFFVTGSLYRPKGKTELMPGVLCPHGHWADGRFHDAGKEAVRKQIVEGAERYEEGGRSPLQARCMQLARMGCIVFHYDMLGYADSQQLSFELVHRFGEPRPEMNTTENWGLYSPQAESRLQSVMGMQTWNSVRALDFLLSLPGIDPKRIAVTGASGGGTQTMLLAAIDPRVSLSFPAVMVSTAMQGGCTCESSCLLRVDTGNIEFAALFAPQPQGMTAADDWTKELATKGYPELRQLYTLLGKPDNLTLANNIQFKHNYNYVNRAVMYDWINLQFQLGLESPINEPDYTRLSREQLTVYDSDHPQPPGGNDFERKLLQMNWNDSQQILSTLIPSDEKSARKFKEVVGGAIDVLIGQGLPAAADVTYEQLHKEKFEAWIRMSGLLRNAKHGSEVPVMFFYPHNWNKRLVICVHENGKAGLFDENGEPNSEVKALLDQGIAVMGMDLIYQGEFLTAAAPLVETRRVANPRLFAGYTFGYNHSVFAQRVHDILAAITFVTHHEREPQQVDLIGLGNVAGPLVAAARAQAAGAVRLAVVDASGFRFSQVTNVHDPRFLPGGAKYYDLPGFLAVAAPGRVVICGESAEQLEVVRAAYDAVNQNKELIIRNNLPASEAWEALRQ